MEVQAGPDPEGSEKGLTQEGSSQASQRRGLTSEGWTVNISAKILMACLVSLSILLLWENDRILTAVLAGLVVFMALMTWKD